MDESEAIQFAEREYESQKSDRDRIFTQIRFLIATCVVILTASISITWVSEPPWLEERVLYTTQWVTIGLVWISTLNLFLLVAIALKPGDYSDPTPLLDFVNWRNSRIVELRKAGYDKEKAAKFAEDEMEAAILENYMESTAINRKQNIKRQETIGRAIVVLIAAAIMLVGQGACSLAIKGYEPMSNVEDNTPTPTPDRTTSTPESAPSSPPDASETSLPETPPPPRVPPPQASTIRESGTRLDEINTRLNKPDVESNG